MTEKVEQLLPVSKEVTLKSGRVVEAGELTFGFLNKAMPVLNQILYSIKELAVENDGAMTDEHIFEIFNSCQEPLAKLATYTCKFTDTGDKVTLSDLESMSIEDGIAVCNLALTVNSHFFSLAARKQAK